MGIEVKGALGNVDCARCIHGDSSSWCNKNVCRNDAIRHCFQKCVLFEDASADCVLTNVQRTNLIVAIRDCLHKMGIVTNAIYFNHHGVDIVRTDNQTVVARVY